MKRVMMLTMWAVVLAVLALTATAGAAPSGRLVYWVAVDVVRGSADPVGAICVQTNVFKQGEEVVWRAEVKDVATGREIGGDGKSLGEIAERGLKVVAYLENGTSFPLQYGQHPPRPKEGEQVNFFWSGAWKIPADYPTGNLKWWVIVTDKAGAFVRFDPIGVGTSLPPVRIVVEKR